MHGTRYINTGDWVESCSAVAETEDGEFVLIKWTRFSHRESTTTVRESQARAA